jgi:hypothetical protein
MLHRRSLLLAVCLVAIIIGCAAIAAAATAAAAPAAASATSSAATAVAADYANALARNQRGEAYNMLSTGSRSGVTLAQWEQSFEQKRPGVRKPPANAVLRAMATAESTPKIGDVVVHGDEAFTAVSGVIPISRTIALVKEGGAWKVDLQATDRLGGRQAAESFLDAIRAESAASQSRQGQEASLPLLRSLLATEASNYRVTDSNIEGDRAQVTVTSDVPVNLVLRATRVGPGWSVDLSRPLVPLDISASDPLQQAVALSDRSACEEQMQALVHAVQMYATSSDDMLPNPSRWSEQVRPFLQGPATLHCPTDSAPGISYAMNRNLAGKKLHQIANPALTVMFYESTLHGNSPADLGQTWPKPARHPEGNLVAYVDGSVRPVSMKPPFDVKEGPPTPTGKVTLPGRRPGSAGAPGAAPQRPQVIVPQQRPR